ncbi:MAG: helix-turn-helix domain-containing protein [bacterium]
MNKKYQPKHIVILSRREKEILKGIAGKGKNGARIIKRARILLKTDQKETDAEIAKETEVVKRTVQRIRTAFVADGLESALYDAPRTGQPAKLDDKSEAHLIAIACSDPPKGRTRWTLELLQKQMIKDGKVKTISTVAIWSYLANRGIKPWREKNVVRSES